MFAPMAYFSFVEMTDPAQHRTYSESQDLGLQPEIRAMPGVAWSDRWVHAPDCAALNNGTDGTLARIHYAEATWFRAPVEVAIRGFHDAHERASHIGAPLSADCIERPLHGLFMPLKGYTHRRVRIAADALPFRPARGIYLLVSRFARRDAEAELAYHWYDATHIPDLLECRGAAGAWSFATADVFRPDRDITAPVLRIIQVYLDDDPLAFVTDMAERTPSWRRAGRLADTSGVEEVLFASPLYTITAWQWDWLAKGH
jgi:hypothetical protein